MKKTCAAAPCEAYGKRLRRPVQLGAPNTATGNCTSYPFPYKIKTWLEPRCLKPALSTSGWRTGGCARRARSTPTAFAPVSGGQGGAAAPAAAPAPEPLEPAVTVHRLPRVGADGCWRRLGLVFAAGRAASLLGRGLGLCGSGTLRRGHGHHGVGRPGRGNCGKIPSKSSSWSHRLWGGVTELSAFRGLGSSSRACCLLSLVGLLLIRHFRFFLIREIIYLGRGKGRRRRWFLGCSLPRRPRR